MVMFLFVIAYLGGRADAPWAARRSLASAAAAVAAVAIAVEVVVAIGLDAGEDLSTSAEITGAFGSPSEIGTLFLSDHLLAFEVTSIVLLVAAAGAVVLGSATRRREALEADDGGRAP
jgi:NADH:ubiquinone oxidoreductase subunit 6 (subunit J)